MDGNPPPRWGAPGEDQVDCTVQLASVGHKSLYLMGYTPIKSQLLWTLLHTPEVRNVL